MIQRIQTLYLLAVTVLAVLQCFFPAVYIGDAPIGFSPTFIFYSAFCAVIPLISLAAIFMYKRRILQMRMCSLNIILMLFELIALAVYVYLSLQTVPGAEWTIEWSATIPLINVILSYLAIRAIGRDEALVRSLDRLRK